MKQQSYLVLWLLGEGMSDIENYLNALIDVQHKCHNTNGAPREGWEYLCIEDFVLREGQPFAAPSSVELPSDVSQGIVKECFKNCVNSVAMRGTDYLYCEGYALGIIPMLHAWLVSPDGQVIDPTWRKPGTEYFGVLFNRKFVLEQTLKQETYGLLDAYTAGWPLLKGIPKDEWAPALVED